MSATISWDATCDYCDAEPVSVMTINDQWGNPTHVERRCRVHLGPTAEDRETRLRTALRHLRDVMSMTLVLSPEHPVRMAMNELERAMEGES